MGMPAACTHMSRNSSHAPSCSGSESDSLLENSRAESAPVGRLPSAEPAPAAAPAAALEIDSYPYCRGEPSGPAAGGGTLTDVTASASAAAWTLSSLGETADGFLAVFTNASLELSYLRKLAEALEPKTEMRARCLSAAAVNDFCSGAHLLVPATPIHTGPIYVDQRLKRNVVID
jgi:hypothetical protein